MGVFLGLSNIPPSYCVPTWWSRSSEVLHYLHVEKPKQGFSAAIYLETLPCLCNSLKANNSTKLAVPLDNANLVTHLLWMCPARWQRQYGLMEKSTPVSTRALVLVLKKIECMLNLMTCPLARISQKGLRQRAKMESVDSRLPKKWKRAQQKALYPF